MSSLQLPLIVYDSDCKVCRLQVENLKILLGGRFHAESFRDLNFFVRHPELTLEECEFAFQFLSRDGRKFSGAEAVARAMALRLIFRPFMWLYYIPGLRWFCDQFYEWIAKNRFKF